MTLDFDLLTPRIWRVHLYPKMHQMCCSKFEEISIANYRMLTIFGAHLSVSLKNPPWGILAFFAKRLGIFSLYFRCLLYVPIYAYTFFYSIIFWRSYMPHISALAHLRHHFLVALRLANLRYINFINNNNNNNIKCDHPACTSADGGHFDHTMGFFDSRCMRKHVVQLLYLKTQRRYSH